MGFKEKTNQRIGSLSGGEKSVLNLAAALLKKPDILILDEPGNHLDYLGLAWLEDFLIKFKGTVLIVSHNRYLLDRVCTHILELENCSVTEYKGNYSTYRMEKLRKLVAQQADFKANQKKLSRLEALVNRFAQICRNTADPAWGKRLRARRSQLGREKADAVEKPLLDERKIGLKLKANGSKANIALKVKDFSFRYGDSCIYDNAAMEINCGEKVALVGLNGSGKTTLIQEIIKKGGWNSSNLRIGPSCNIGYLSQKQDVLNPDNTIEEEIISLGAIKSREQAYHVVAPFMFSYNDLSKKIATLSGGEKNRLQLARLKYLNSDFLILDEPTNHLDISSREAVEEALMDFKGTLLIVSHDRYFLDAIVDRVVEIEERKLVPHVGNFSEFWFEKNSLQRKMKGNVSKRKTQRDRVIKENVNINKVNKDIVEIENRISLLEEEKLSAEKRIAEVFNQGNFIEGKKLSDRLAKISSQLDKAYSIWESIL
jgi:ATP-binding cassette, subfamily F, member 3